MDQNSHIPQGYIQGSPVPTPEAPPISLNTHPQPQYIPGLPPTVPPHLIQGLKRRHDYTHSAPHDPKRWRGIENGTFEDARYLIAHQVICTRHPNHNTSLYHDTPQLFAGDSRVIALHGQRKIDEAIFSPEFADENSDISFIVLKMYDCGQYHDEHLSRDAFQVIRMPEGIAKALASFKAHLSFLSEDGPKAEAISERIFFISRELKAMMKDVRARHPLYFPSTNTPDSVDAPYLGLYHAREIMEGDVLGLESGFHEVQRAHGACLVEYIRTSRSDEYEEAEKQFKEGKVSKRHFSKLFAPNDVVVRMTDDGPVGYVISDFPDNKEFSVDLNCWTWEFDGTFYKQNHHFTVEWISTEITTPIASLSVYPLKFDRTGLKERLRRRGLEFWACRKQRLVERDSITTSFEFRATCNRFMIDLNTYRQMHPEAVQAHQSNEAGIEDEDLPPEGDFLMLLPPVIRGYGFHDKKWSKLPVDHIHDVRWNGNTFDSRLVLKPRKKELIKALVTVHSSPDKPRKSDIIEGKGKGLILLLHGSPGTGKTLTAESIAEYAQRPLYRVTCGDIGTDPESVEKYLESVLYIGTIWGAVLLLDEADVFLEERTATDLQRNALVSVFLRTLEYFEGILILTSNRVGTFDEAFKSRVQLAMHYPPLDKNDRKAVWNMFFQDMLEGDERLKHDELDDKLTLLATERLNGRQIRNVINTARQLAKYRKEVLCYSHIEQALEVASEFEEYITRTRGHSDEEYAQAEGLRADHKAG